MSALTVAIAVLAVGVPAAVGLWIVRKEEAARRRLRDRELEAATDQVMTRGMRSAVRLGWIRRGEPTTHNQE